MLFFVSVSWGNDSVALVQWLHEKYALGEHRVICVYADTGWAASDWPARVERGEALARSYGFEVARLHGGNFVELAMKKKSWPRNGMQFCTEELKVKPLTAFHRAHDPDKEGICVAGIRRAESRARAQWPEDVPESPKHDGRDAWFPLVRVTDEERDALLHRAGFEVLAQRSRECFPCIHANRADLRLLPEARIAEIEQLEAAMGHTEEGKPRTLFRPYHHQGATGIRETIAWAWSERGQYDPSYVPGCDSGVCGD